MVGLTYALIGMGFEAQTGKFWKSLFWPITAGRVLATVAREKGML